MSAHPLVVRIRAALPMAGDVVYVLGSLWISTAMLTNYPDAHGYWRERDALAYLLLGAIILPQVLRRRFPAAVLVNTAFWTACYFTRGYYHVPAVGCLLLPLYTVAARRERRISVRCAVLVVLVELWGSRLAEPGIVSLSAGFVVVAAAVGWKAGDGSRRLRELTRRLRREQEEKARRAVMEERIQIARELHDVIAHHVSVIAVQTGVAGYVVTTDPATARSALDVIAASAREALGEMRRMLVVLRAADRVPAAPGAAAQPAPEVPGLGRLGELAARVSAAGVPVRVRITGSAYALPPGIDLCAYRVVQEALTNVMKHAPAARTTVHVHYARDSVSVLIKDEGAPRRVSATGLPSSGQGLIGMRERATIYHGTVVARSVPEGGFEVSLTVPVPRPVAAR
ncbi:sensor histidine kinase [Streptomyces sp. NPDC059917]|uniref:sensor histidine kinase n=1 Tax=Streptomyces sp. NPDC059917 TaxID=3347002 RepID=UPI0036516DA8